MRDREFKNLEREVLGKLGALSFFLNNKDIARLEKDFRKYKDFVLANQHRDFRTVERELMQGLHQAALVH